MADEADHLRTQARAIMHAAYHEAVKLMLNRAPGSVQDIRNLDLLDAMVLNFMKPVDGANALVQTERRLVATQIMIEDVARAAAIASRDAIRDAETAAPNVKLVDALKEARAFVEDEQDRRGDEDKHYPTPAAKLLERIDVALGARVTIDAPANDEGDDYAPAAAAE